MGEGEVGLVQDRCKVCKEELFAVLDWFGQQSGKFV